MRLKTVHMMRQLWADQQWERVMSSQIMESLKIMVGRAQAREIELRAHLTEAGAATPVVDEYREVIETRVRAEHKLDLYRQLGEM